MICLQIARSSNKGRAVYRNPSYDQVTPEVAVAVGTGVPGSDARLKIETAQNDRDRLEWVERLDCQRQCRRADPCKRQTSNGNVREQRSVVLSSVNVEIDVRRPSVRRYTNRKGGKGYRRSKRWMNALLDHAGSEDEGEEENVKQPASAIITTPSSSSIFSNPDRHS